MFSLETLYLCTSISRASILVVFAVLLYSQPKAQYLWHWSVALLTSGLGALLSIFDTRFSVDNPLILGLFLTSLLMSWSGLRLFYGKEYNSKLIALFIVVPCLLLDIADRAFISDAVKLPLACILAGAMAALSVYEIFNSLGSRIYSQYIVALALSGYTLLLSLTAFCIFAGWLDADVKANSVMSLVFDQVAGILIYFGYIAMWSERAFLDLKVQAKTDPLTGLINRRGGLEILDRLQAAPRNSTYSVIIGDVDHFKNINDTYGHEVGDQVLVMLGQRLRTALRNSDIAVRWGGEEFLIILPCTELNAAEHLAERLRVIVESPSFKTDSGEFFVTLSLGVASRTEESSIKFTLLKADHALYKSKREGRNRVSRAL